MRFFHTKRKAMGKAEREHEHSKSRLLTAWEEHDRDRMKIRSKDSTQTSIRVKKAKRRGNYPESMLTTGITNVVAPIIPQGEVEYGSSCPLTAYTLFLLASYS